MNRFNKSKNNHRLFFRIMSTAAVFCCAAWLLLHGVSSVSATADDTQADSLRQAVLRSAVHCYAMEGKYPESLDYITAHYGIRWDESRYFIDYEITGSNLMPTVTVIPLEG